MFGKNWKTIELPCVLTVFLKQRAENTRISEAKKRGELMSEPKKGETTLVELQQQAKTGTVKTLQPFPLELEICIEEFKIVRAQVSDVVWYADSLDRLFKCSPYIEAFEIAEGKRLYRYLSKNKKATIVIGWR